MNSTSAKTPGDSQSALLRHAETAMVRSSIIARLRRSTALLGLIPAAVYLVLASRSLSLPGIYYDEVLQAVPAIAALQGGVHGPIVEVQGSVIHLAGRPFPLFILPYLGSTQAMALTLTFAFAHSSVITLRATFLVLGAIAIVMTFLFARRMFDTWTAALGTLLLAVDPSYIFATRSDNGPTAIMMICKMGALWLLLAWWQTRRPYYLVAATFLIGVGLYDKLYFAWLLGGLGIGLIVLRRRSTLERLTQLPVRTAVSSLVAFGAGSSILLAYVVLSRGGPLRAAMNATSSTTTFGVDNSHVLANLVYRFTTLGGLLRGYTILDFYTSAFGGYQIHYNRGSFPSTLLPLLVAAAFVICILEARFAGACGRRGKAARFLFLLSAVIVVESAVTPTTLSYHHLLMVYPFPHLLAAYGITTVPLLIRSRWPNRRIRITSALTASVVVAALTLVSSISVVGTYYRVLEQTGGVGMWSDAIYGLADYLQGDQRTIVCMDWGISQNLLFLSRGQLHTEEAWTQFLYASGDSSAVAPLVRRPNQVFVFHTPRYTGSTLISGSDQPRAVFFSTLGELGGTPKLEKSFTQRDGETVLQLYTVSFENATEQTRQADFDGRGRSR